MKTIIVYDSKYGNTKNIAEEMGKALSKANEVEVIHAKDALGKSLQDYELIIVGSPTNGGQPSESAKLFLEAIVDGSLDGKKAAAFDTGSTLIGQNFIGKAAIKLFGYAAPRTAKILESKGAKILASETFYVKGFEGPILDGEIERAQKWITSI